MNPRLGTLAAVLVCALVWLFFFTWLLGWPVNGGHAVLALAVVLVLAASVRDQRVARRPGVYDWRRPGGGYSRSRDVNGRRAA